MSDDTETLNEIKEIGNTREISDCLEADLRRIILLTDRHQSHGCEKL